MNILCLSCYLDQENNYYFYFKKWCQFCRKTEMSEHQLCLKQYNGINANVQQWLVSYKKSDKNIIIIKPVM